MSTAQKATQKQVAFYIPKDQEQRLAEAARRYGFDSVSLFARAVLLRAIGTPEDEVALKRIGEMRARIQKNIMGIVMRNVDTMTAEELLGDGE